MGRHGLGEAGSRISRCWSDQGAQSGPCRDRDRRDGLPNWLVVGEPALMEADVIVVGGGHNGLICAAYLARAGVNTLLLEAAPGVGGCASTVDDLGARFNICNCDHTLVRAMPIIDELELVEHGLR